MPPRARKPRAGPKSIYGWRREFDRSVRRAAVDVIQAGNYVDRSEYDRAFENVESACRELLREMRRLKDSLAARGAPVPAAGNPG